MEAWVMISIAVLVSVFKVPRANKCNIEPKGLCELVSVMARDYTEFKCPIPGDGPVSWYYRDAPGSNWTSYPFEFCPNLPWARKQCQIKDKTFMIDEVFSENKGFYECRRNGSNYCFELTLYSCERGSKPLPRGPPKTVSTQLKSSVVVACGIDFCDDNNMGFISWYHKGEIITFNNSRVLWTCFRKNETNMESNLVIDNVGADDFLHPFVCNIEDSNGIVLSSFNVSLVNAGPDVNFKDSYLLPSILISVWFVILFILLGISLACLLKKCQGVRFIILSQCSFCSRLPYFKNYDYAIDVFILHDNDDNDIADSFRSDLIKQGFRVAMVADFNPGVDATKEIKDSINKFASAIVIYPRFHITNELDHQISVVKENIRPYLITLLLDDERTSISYNDKKLMKLKLKQIIYKDNINFKCVKWRLPKCIVPQKQKMYGAMDV